MVVTSLAVIHLKDFIMLHSVIVEKEQKVDWIFWLTVKWTQADAGLSRNFLKLSLLLLHMSFSSAISHLSFSVCTQKNNCSAFH